MAQAQTETRTPAIEATIKGRVLTLAFSNGQALELDAGQLTDGIVEQALMHGLKQKLVDAAAISRDPDTGRTATIDTKFAAVKEVFDRLLAGEWNKRREGAGAVTGGLLFAAMCRVYAATKTPEEVKAYLATKTDEEKAQMRKIGKIAAAIEAIKAERAKPTEVDEAALLAGLED